MNCIKTIFIVLCRFYLLTLNEMYLQVATLLFMLYLMSIYGESDGHTLFHCHFIRLYVLMFSHYSLIGLCYMLQYSLCVSMLAIHCVALHYLCSFNHLLLILYFRNIMLKDQGSMYVSFVFSISHSRYCICIDFLLECTVFDLS